MSRRFILAAAATLAVPAAALANPQTVSSPKRGDIPAFQDIRRAGVTHKSKSLLHSVQTFGTWKTSQLTDTSSPEDGELKLVVEIAVTEPRWYLIAGDYTLYATTIGGQHGYLRNNQTGKTRRIAIAHPDARTLRWTLPKSAIGNPKRYWWAAVSVATGTSVGSGENTPWTKHVLR